MIVLLTTHHKIFGQAEGVSREAAEGGSASPNHMGASISGVRQLQALADAPWVERLIAYAPPASLALATKAAHGSLHAGRLEVLDEAGLRAAFRPEDPVVIVQFGVDLLRSQTLRWACGSPRWPVSGYTYSIATTGVHHSLVLSVASGIQSYDSVLCCSTSARVAMDRLLTPLVERFPGARKPRLPVVPLGLDAESFEAVSKAEARRALALPEEATVFLYLGRVDPRYKANLQPLLTAFSQIGPVHEAHLVVAGGRPHSGGDEILDRLRFRAVELGLGGRVHWHTDVSVDVRRQLLSAADVFVSPVDNLQESFGIAVVEAMCAGLPVIASDWNGYRDIVAHEETGLLVPTRLPHDISPLSRHAALSSEYDFHWELAEATIVDLPALTRAMARLATDQDLRASMGRKGRERARARFDWSVVTRSWRVEWESQLEAARAAAGAPPPPLVVDHAAAFADHPTERLGPDTRVRRTPEALVPSVVTTLPPPFLKGAILQEIVESTGDVVSLSELSGMSPERRLHAAYLIKHGLLEVVG